MIIRKPISTDVNNIITLIQLSLGETKIKKSQKNWNYKHVDNPFGVSPVLLAEENDMLVGVRAFMCWKWQINDQVTSAYRAVDTSTHPDFQGRGIFNKLTLSALDLIGENGSCFVFNTPNDKSRPGYIKMGWKVVGKIKVSIVPTFIYLFLIIFFKKDSNKISKSDLQKLCDNNIELLKTKNKYFTPKSFAYLKWRYENNPLQDYIIVSDSSYYVVMYVKKHKFLKELRIVECISDKDFKTRLVVRSMILKYAMKYFCWIITTADKNLFPLSFYGSFGPQLTIRPVACSTGFVQDISSIDNWNYELGDLELF